jgi:hydrogenase nickel incorporation protein HypA/HybF
MHELPVTENILEIAVRHAQNAGASRILGLNIVIGQLASIIDDSVQFYWEIIAKDTLGEGAELHFKRIPIEMLCTKCGHRYNPKSDDLLCPACSSELVKIVSGKEFYLESIDIE